MRVCAIHVAFINGIATPRQSKGWIEADSRRETQAGSLIKSCSLGLRHTDSAESLGAKCCTKED